MSSDAYLPAEARARVEIDRQLTACGWLVQGRAEMSLYAGEGVAVREFIMAPGHGRADYLLFVDGKAAGAVEAKPSGTPLAGVESQTAKYAAGLPAELTAAVFALEHFRARDRRRLHCVESVVLPQSVARTSA